MNSTAFRLFRLDVQHQEQGRRRRVRGGGRGGQNPRTFENRRGRAPINLDISVYFFLKCKKLHFPTFSK